jgi:hypothetical protein
MNKYFMIAGIAYIVALTLLVFQDIGSVSCGEFTTWLDVVETILLVGFPFTCGYFGKK